MTKEKILYQIMIFQGYFTISLKKKTSLSAIILNSDDIG